MRNEYGVTLDKNEYAPSIMQAETKCFWCGDTHGKLDRHEPFGGALRSKSKRLGMWCYLCHDTCHLRGAHGDATMGRELKKRAQQAAMEHYGIPTAEFIKLFGKNYL